MTKAAEERIRNDFEFNKNEIITVYKIQKHEKTKELQSTLDLQQILRMKYKSSLIGLIEY